MDPSRNLILCCLVFLISNFRLLRTLSYALSIGIYAASPFPYFDHSSSYDYTYYHPICFLLFAVFQQYIFLLLFFHFRHQLITSVSYNITEFI